MKCIFWLYSVLSKIILYDGSVFQGLAMVVRKSINYQRKQCRTAPRPHLQESRYPVLKVQKVPKTMQFGHISGTPLHLSQHIRKKQNKILLYVIRTKSSAVILSNKGFYANLYLSDLIISLGKRASDIIIRPHFPETVGRRRDAVLCVKVHYVENICISGC